MTAQEVVKLFAVIVILFPRDKAFERADVVMAQAWAKALGDIDYATAEAAVAAVAATSPFPPSISEIRKYTVSPGMTADDAWGQLKRALRKYGYTDPKGARASLPPDVWKTVENMGGWYEFCANEDPEGVVHGFFIKAWEVAERRRGAERLIPEQVRKALERGRNELQNTADTAELQQIRGA